MKRYLAVLIAAVICLSAQSVSFGAVEGWVKTNAGWCFKRSDGSTVLDSWFQDKNGSWYYFGADGYRKSGWLNKDDVWYYLDDDGVMASGQWKFVDGVLYYFAQDGALETEFFNEKKEKTEYVSPYVNGGSSGSSSGASGGTVTKPSYDYVNDEDYRSEDGFNNAYADRLLTEVNTYRTAAGLGALTEDAGLMAAARARAQELTLGYSQKRPTGIEFNTLLKSMNIEYKTAAQSIGNEERNPKAAADKWMESQTNRKNILNSEFTRTGTGCYVYKGTTYWVQIFISTP